MNLINQYNCLLRSIGPIREVSQFISRNTQKAFSISAANNAEATVDLPEFKLHKLDKGPATSATINTEEALVMYEKLICSRRLETASSNLYKAKKIRGFCHLYMGQEAVAIGMHSALRPVDSVITSYRCHPWTYMMGAGGVTAVLAELTGVKSGCSRGKGGSMHMYGKNFYGGNGIVGAQTPLGAGIALANKYKENGGVCFAMYGDGAANQGQLFEAMNIAKLLGLPCVFLCENNEYGMGTSKNRSSASTAYYTRGDYVPGLWVDGMDVLASREATRFAIEFCNSAKSPLVIEMETYRYTGHSMSDPGTSYRSREEVQNVRKTRDPIMLFKDMVLSKNVLTEDQMKEIDEKVKKIVDEAIKVATTDSEVPISELTADVYANCLDTPLRGLTPNMKLQHMSTRA